MQSSAVAAEPGPVVAPQTESEEDPMLANAPAPEVLAEARATAVPAEKTLPPNIHPNSQVVEVIKLANSGLDEGVLMSFVHSSPSTFSLDPEQIIYLNDIGVPGTVVAAMIQRDQALKGSFAAAPPTVAPAPVPTPEQVAPQPAYTGTYPPEQQPPAQEVSDGSFYDALSPYGTWVDVDGYGRCWQPTVVIGNPGWQPYFDCGHWVYTDCGWYWMSSYSWGWAPFHYGRWFHHNHMGWCWAPGRVWGPSWVSWRYSNAYCGWAPLGPGVSFSFAIGLTWHGHPVHEHDACGLDWHHYHFVAWHDFHDHHLQQHALAADHVSRIYNQTQVATRISTSGGTAVNHGLPVERVAAATHTTVRPVALRETTTARPVTGRTERLDTSRGTLTVYRPTAQPLQPTSAASASSVTPRPGTTTFSPTARPSQNGVPTMRPAPSSPRAGATPMRTVQNSPLILRGPDQASGKEIVPANSLVMRGAKTPDSTAPNNYAAWNNPANQPARSGWQSAQTPTSANSPSPWLNGQNQNPAAAHTDSRDQQNYGANAQANVYGYRATTPPAGRDTGWSQHYQTPTYQAPTRSAPVEVPRANYDSGYGSQRAYSPPPAASAQSRPTGPAPPPAPAAGHAQPQAQSQSNSARNGK